jgi:hypothetical protein
MCYGYNEDFVVTDSIEDAERKSAEPNSPRAVECLRIPLWGIGNASNRLGEFLQEPRCRKNTAFLVPSLSVLHSSIA